MILGLGQRIAKLLAIEQRRPDGSVGSYILDCEQSLFCSKIRTENERGCKRDMRALLTARGFTNHALTFMLFCVLPSVFPWGFSRLDYSQSTYILDLI